MNRQLLFSACLSKNEMRLLTLMVEIENAIYKNIKGRYMAFHIAELIKSIKELNINNNAIQPTQSISS